MNNKGFTHILVVILIGVMAVGLVGVAWYYEVNREGVVISSDLNPGVNLNTNTSTVVKNWETITYQSNYHNFSFDIPTDWENMEQPIHNEERIPLVTVYNKEGNQSTSLTVNYYKNSSQSLYDWVVEHEKELVQSHEDIISSESDWMRDGKIIIAAEMKEVFKHMHCYVSSNDVIYEIYLSSEISNWDSYKEIFEQACDTFLVPNELVDIKNKKIFSNNELSISFEFQSSWEPANETIENTVEGNMKKYIFLGSGELSFGSTFSLIYSTIDFAPGREIWQGEVLSKYDKENSLDNICNEGAEEGWSWGNDVRNCTEQQIDGKTVVDYYTRLDALGGGETIYFVRVFAFQTDNKQYPVGVLALFLSDNNILFEGVDSLFDINSYNANDLDTINNTYNKIINRVADETTNNLLKEFDDIVDTFQFID